jgi:hypothetical protein
MALKGNLRDFPITQLLNLVNVAQKTGTLIVERPEEQVYVSFRDGKLSYARNGSGPASLTMVLYHSKKLNAAQVRAINERTAGMGDKELGLLLINSNFMSQQEILSSLQSYYLNMVNRLFTWREGLFNFDAEMLPPKDKITVRISLENIIMEGTRRMREWEQLQAEIPSLEMALKFSQRPGINLRNLSLSADEWKVISFINPKNTIHQIARATNKNELEIRRIVYSFLQAGLVDMVRPQGIPVLRPVISTTPLQTAQTVQSEVPTQPVRSVPTDKSEQAYSSVQGVSSDQSFATIQTVQTEESEPPVQSIQPRISLPQGAEFKSLVNRIINRIRSI